MATLLRILLATTVAFGVASCSSDDDSETTTTTTEATASDDEADAADSEGSADESGDDAVEEELSITSEAFTDGAAIPAEYTCDGANTQPPLAITGTPEDATGLVLIVDDPDAPNGSFIHWVVWNLEPDATIPEGSLPEGAVEGTNGTSNTAWFGPCPPPDGPHNYEFQLSAVDAEPAVAAGATADEVRSAIADSTVATATLVGTYERT
ncbi:MAG: YbhB/YbcL family Raf kinase inhibitor-like protein [Microthrixaceae bacterium]